MPNLAHVAARVFGTPLMVHESKLQAILAGLGERFGARPAAFDDADEAAQRMPSPARRPYQVTSQGAAIVPIVGVLVNRAGQIDAESAPLRSYSAIGRDIQLAMGDPAVRAVVLDIDSPGGECAGCFELAASIRGMRGRKPIVAVANGYAYSAAYALGSAADVLFVSTAGGVGSVGIVALHVDQSKRDEQRGLAYEYIFAGAKKIDGSSHAPLTDGARADLNAEVERCYGIFTALVAANRSMAVGKVRATEAGCFYGDTAVAAGLADRVGTLEDAVAEAARRADAVAPASTKPGSSPRGAHSRGENMEPEDTTVPTGAEEQNPSVPLAQPARIPAVPGGAASKPGLSAEEAASIIDLCMLAGQPQAAAGFIREGKTRGEVSEALLRGRAAGQEQTSISASHGTPGTTESGRGGNPADPHGWNASIARVCGDQKGA